MGIKRFKPEEIISKLRQVEILCNGRCDTPIGVSEQTCYLWKKNYGGLRTDQLKELKTFQKENQRLRKAVSDLTLDKLILQESAKGNF